MCGLAGFIDPRRDAQSAAVLLHGMLGRIAHRGPDDTGCWHDGPVALGHRRLSIVDLSPLGHQPMQSASGRYVVAFNGEIYNHADLRDDLQRHGAVFRGQSDTEVLLALVEQTGLDQALRRCVGMFAIALWDRKERVLQLVRDRFGEKPLYWACDTTALVFGSELKAMLAHPAVDRAVNPVAVRDLLASGHVRAPCSIFAGVRQVTPGCIVEVSGAHNGHLTAAERPYWSAEEVARAGRSRPFQGSLDEAATAVTARLEAAVRLQMQADVPLGAFLSGGIDSSLVVALMQRCAREPVRTYSIGFQDDLLDESSHARAVAHHLGTVHTGWHVHGSEVRDLIPDLPDRYDEPLADASQLPTLVLARLTRRDVTVALSGDGADELFGGYPKYGLGQRLRRQRGRRWVGQTARVVSQWLTTPLSRRLPTPLSRRIAWHRVDALAAVYGATTDAELARSLGAVNRRPLSFMAASLRPLAAGAMPSTATLGDYRRDAMLADLQDYLPNDILVKVDRATMAASLESRAPFLDHRILELAASLPDDLLFEGGRGKRVLRHALGRLLPLPLVDRPKAGFIPPLGRWLRGPLREWAQDTLSSQAAGTLLDVDACRRLLALHGDGRFDLSARLWPMLTLAAWGRRWLGAPSL